MGELGKRERRKAATRLAIIDAAVALAYTHGFDRTTVEGIAAEAGVSPATVFNYFPSKADIFFADAGLYRVSEPFAPRATPWQTVAEAVAATLFRADWTRSIADPVTRMRFAVVRREPELAARQAALMFREVPVIAVALRRAHPDLSPTAALTVSGAAVGAVHAVVAHGHDDLERGLREALAALTERGRSGEDPR